VGEATTIRVRLEEAARSGEFLDWTLEQLKEAHKSLREARAVLRIDQTVDWFGGDDDCRDNVDWYDDCRDKLTRAIELKEIEAQAERHHRENRNLGRWTLFWAALAGIGTVVLVLFDTPLSTLLRAMSSRLAPVSSKQSLPSVAATKAPTATLSPSESTPASPTPSATTTPIKFPPPAP